MCVDFDVVVLVRRSMWRVIDWYLTVSVAAVRGEAAEQPWRRIGEKTSQESLMLLLKKLGRMSFDVVGDLPDSMRSKKFKS